jgi:hypothetical protein
MVPPVDVFNANGISVAVFLSRRPSFRSLHNGRREYFRVGSPCYIALAARSFEVNSRKSWGWESVRLSSRPNRVMRFLNVDERVVDGVQCFP